MNTDPSNKLTFPKRDDLTFIQEFVNTKVHHPDLIKQLKLKQLQKIQLQKAKLRQQNLLLQLKNNNQNLIKTQKVDTKLKQSTFTNYQEASKIQQKIIQMEQKLQKLIVAFKQFGTDSKDEKDLNLKELMNLTQQSSKQLEDEHQKFKKLLEEKTIKLTTALQKKLKLNESLQSRQNQVKLKQAKIESTKKSNQLKRQSLIRLGERKINLSERIKSKVLSKEQNLRKIQVKLSENTKSEEECIKKLVKFAKELQQIVQDPKSQLQEKKTMISLLLNVYCPDETIQDRVRSISIEIACEKQKHDSIQTRISLQNQSGYSINQQQSQVQHNPLKIPFILLHTLQQTGRKYGLRPIQKDSTFQLPQKKFKNQQTQIKSRLSKLNHRDSLPTSLNEEDIQNQFIAYCQNQMNDLMVSQRILDQKQGKLQKQILLLTKKSQQKDSDIKSIREQNRKIYPKS